MNGQVLVFNADLPLFEAINALAEHGIFCGVLWNESKKEFADLFTIRDIMELLIFMATQLQVRYGAMVSKLKAEDQKEVTEFISHLSQSVADLKKPRSDSAPVSTPALDEDAQKTGFPVLYGLLRQTKLSDWANISCKLVSSYLRTIAGRVQA